MNIKSLLLFVALVVAGLWAYTSWVDSKVIVTSPTPTYTIILEGTQQSPSIMEPTWTPFYVLPTITPEVIQVRVRSTADVPTGQVGSHNPGRSDSRTP